MLYKYRFAVVKVLLFLLSLLPLAGLVYAGLFDQLGAEPVEKILHTTGEWSLHFLILTLALTPLRTVFGWSGWIRFRRILGLFSFFYLLLHFGTYLWLEHYFDWTEISKDILKRPYVTVGFAAFLMMLPLAFTSTNGWKRRLGKRWRSLHQLIYVIAVLAILHFLWLVKADYVEPIVYGLIVIGLLLARRPNQALQLNQLGSRIRAGSRSLIRQRISEDPKGID